jgi:hypothetical protein
MVLANRQVTIDEVACFLQNIHGSAYQIIQDELVFHKVFARWVPRELTAEHKRKRVEVCQRILNYYNNEGKEFLKRIVTGDETWVHHCEPESKSQSMVWKHLVIMNEEEIQDSIFHRKGDANHFLGLKRAYAVRLPGKEVYCSLFLLGAHF